MIDQPTVDRIIEAANIVEVVSDFVTLRRRGANYVGLCPFHDEKTPSFSVSPARGICKCFSCGKGGNAIHFIMEHEQISYYEALKYLARKYNIEIQEKQLTEEEKQRKTDRESMLIVNEYAQKYFTTTLFEHSEGRSIGMAYFRERGFGEDIIKKFALGYSLEKRDALAQDALLKGYNKEYLIKTGLCFENQQGNLYDRYKGRVIFPIHSLSGKVIAFGGRILKKDEKSAKYVNSPESEVYHKSDVLYGIYQAKQSIVKNDFCYLVEGYTDVISMHQAGIENVVASSGTSLTPGQIRLIHRFTNNITVLYDGDAAGIKASLRGIDLILQEGMNIKVVLLPDGEDPDSFSKRQSAADFTAYIQAHGTDFIRFKTNLLLAGAGNDPIKRATLIGDIVRSIAIIPDNILRTIYIQDCARLLEIDEKMLLREVNNLIRNRLQQEANSAGGKFINNVKQTYPLPTLPDRIVAPPPTEIPLEQLPDESTSVALNAENTLVDVPNRPSAPPPTGEYSNTETSQPIILPTKKRQEDRLLEECERMLIRYILRYGYATLSQSNENGEISTYKVIDYIRQELEADGVTFTTPIYAHMYKECCQIDPLLAQQYGEIKLEQNLGSLQHHLQQEIDEINSNTSPDPKLIQLAEERFQESCRTCRYEAEISYLGHHFINDPDNTISSLSIDLISDKHQLSKIHTKFQIIERDIDRLNELIPRAVFELKDAILSMRIEELSDKLRTQQKQSSTEELTHIIEQIAQYTEVRRSFAIYLGERIITPKS